jgi:hypothetical protein
MLPLERFLYVIATTVLDVFLECTLWFQIYVQQKRTVAIGRKENDMIWIYSKYEGN